MTLPKQARSKATRQKIIKASVDCLREFGASGATTTVIATRAGVSQGALFKHFPNKSLLLAAATDAVFHETRQFFVFESIRRYAAGEEVTLRALLEILWGIYQRPSLQAVFELYMAARTDEVLREVLQPIVTAHLESVTEIAKLIFPTVVDSRLFNDTIISLMMALQGASLMIGMVPESHEAHLHLDFLAEFAQQVLGPPDFTAIGATA